MRACVRACVCGAAEARRAEEEKQRKEAEKQAREEERTRKRLERKTKKQEHRAQATAADRSAGGGRQQQVSSINGSHCVPVVCAYAPCLALIGRMFAPTYKQNPAFYTHAQQDTSQANDDTIRLWGGMDAEAKAALVAELPRGYGLQACANFPVYHPYLMILIANVIGLFMAHCPWPMLSISMLHTMNIIFALMILEDGTRRVPYM